MHFDAHHLDARDIERRRDRAATSFDSADFLHQRAHEGLSERLEPMVMTPSLIVDLGAGTGAMSRRLAKQYRKARVLSVDSSRAMLDVARANDPAGTYELGSAENLAACFEPGEFDAVYSVYTLRNFADTNAAVRAMAHVLAPGGTLVILDAFPPPKGSFMAVALRFWMNVVVAAIVKPFTDAKAYRYLAASIEQTRTPEETADILRREGFEDVQITTYSFGAAAMLLGSKR